MGKALLAVGTLLVVLIGVFILTVYLTQEDESYAVDNLLAENLSREIATAEENRRQVDLAAITDFEWDEVLVVAEDTPHEEIEAELGTDFQGQLNYDIESRELFVFLDDGELVRFADYRGRAAFVGVDRPIDRMTPEEAVFEVRDLVVRPVGAPAEN